MQVEHSIGTNHLLAQHEVSAVLSRQPIPHCVREPLNRSRPLVGPKP
jgi:hypothetical protein